VCFRKKGKESAEIGSVNLVKERGGFEVCFLYVLFSLQENAREKNEGKSRGFGFLRSCRIGQIDLINI